MRCNGLLWYETSVGGGIDENGEQIPVTQEWSEPLECQITTSTDTRKGRYEDGIFRQASFSILVECETRLSPSRVKLERFREGLGEYQVISVTPLPSVGRLQIIV